MADSEKEKIYSAIVRDTLKALATKRAKEKKWADDEKESPEESCAYKNSEILSAFFTANRMEPQQFSTVILDKELVWRDTTSIISAIEKDGFYPSPYTYIREKSPFIDFAAQAVALFIDVKRYFEPRRFLTTHKAKKLDSVIKNGIKFLVENVQTDKNGSRWAGSTRIDVGGRSYCNVYFTGAAISALYYACVHYSELLHETLKTEMEKLIRGGIRWILEREEGGLIKGDEERMKGEINHTIYGLNALFSCWDMMEGDAQRNTSSVFDRFVQYVNANQKSLQLQMYFDVAIKGVRKPIYYDDRSTVGNIVTVLCQGHNFLREKKLDENFYALLSTLVNALIGERDPLTKLWDKGEFYLYYNTRAVEALLAYEQFGMPIFYEFSEREAVAALRSTMSNPTVAEIFLDELRKSGLKQKIERMVKDMTEREAK